MPESIRSLTVKLGYDIDTTGADIFRTRFNSLKAFLQKSAGSLKGRISLRDLFGKTNLSGLEKDFNTRFTKASNRMASHVKKAMLVVAAAVAAGVAAATKIFTKFAGIEQARGALEFRAGDEFDEFIKKIDKIRGKEGIKGLVSELDALNALNLGADIIGDFDFLADNFETVVKLSKVLGKDVGEVQQAFANFVATGSNLQELVKFGFFTPEQLDALKKASTDFSQQGLETRKALLGTKIEEGAPRLEESFQKFTERSQANIDRLGVAAEDATVALGTNFAPSINEILKDLTDSARRFGEALNQDRGFLNAFLDSFQSTTARSIIRFFGGDLPETEDEKRIRLEKETKKEGEEFEALQPNTPTPLVQNIIDALSGKTKPVQNLPFSLTAPFKNQSGAITDNSTNTFNINGVDKDKAEIAREVESTIAKKVIQSSIRREIPQALNTTVKPATSQ